MEIYTGNEKIKNNKIIGNLNLTNSTVEFTGIGNILYCNGTINIENSRLRFTGSNSIIFFDENDYPFSLNIRVGNDSVFYLGKDCYVNKISDYYATERKNIIIGKKCLLSYGCVYRTADPHLIYDITTKERVNFSKSILIGDHVWIGQRSTILKNSYIGSGAIIGASSVVANKRIESNTIYAGNPVKKIRSNVFYDGPMSTNNYTEVDEFDSKYSTNTDGIFEYDETTIDLKEIDAYLRSLDDPNMKIEYILKTLVNNNDKNRFYL